MFFAKEPYVSDGPQLLCTFEGSCVSRYTKEPYISANEPSDFAKEPYVFDGHWPLCSLGRSRVRGYREKPQKSPMFLKNSPVSSQKSPEFPHSESYVLQASAALQFWKIPNE